MYIYIRSGRTVILRSTIAPGTTEFVKKFIERHTSLIVGKDVSLCFCPERIAEGKAYKEIHELPQIIGSEDVISAQNTESIFKRLVPDIFHTDYI